MTLHTRPARSSPLAAVAVDVTAHASGKYVMPLAIIGLSCRLPGSASSPEKLWEMLANGRNAWTPNAGDRFNMEQFYHPEIGKKGSVSPSNSNTDLSKTGTDICKGSTLPEGRCFEVRHQILQY